MDILTICPATKEIIASLREKINYCTGIIKKQTSIIETISHQYFHHTHHIHNETQLDSEQLKNQCIQFSKIKRQQTIPQEIKNKQPKIKILDKENENSILDESNKNLNKFNQIFNTQIEAADIEKPQI